MQVERIQFITIDTDEKTFNSILKYKLPQIFVENNEYWNNELNKQNEFIRFKEKEFYMDVGIRRILLKSPIIIYLGDIIDCNKVSHRKNKSI